MPQEVKMPKVPSIAIHAVAWEDATYSDTEQTDTVMAVTIGVILENSDKKIVVASEIFSDKTSRHYTSIPKRMVERVVRVGTVKLPEFDKPALPVEEEE